MASWTTQRETLQAIAKSFDSSIKLCTKDNFFSKLLAWLLFLATFGKVKRESFLTHYATTIGNFHFYPKEWSATSVERTLPHEARHTAQFRALGCFIHPLVGLPLAMVVFILFPLPVFLAYGRFYMEYDADRTSFRYKLKYMGYSPDSIMGRAEERAVILSSAAYGWCWPRKWAEKSYLKLAEQVINEFNEDNQ